MSKLKNLESTVTLAQKSIMIAFRELGGRSGIIYSGLACLSEAVYLLRTIETLRLDLVVEYKEEYKETEWKLVNENGTYHSTGDNQFEYTELDPANQAAVSNTLPEDVEISKE